MAKTNIPSYDSGKTYFSRIKQVGESWTQLRAEAGEKAGCNETWRHSDMPTHKTEKGETCENTSDS